MNTFGPTTSAIFCIERKAGSRVSSSRSRLKWVPILIAVYFCVCQVTWPDQRQECRGFCCRTDCWSQEGTRWECWKWGQSYIVQFFCLLDVNSGGHGFPMLNQQCIDFRSSFPNDASCIGSVTSILGTWGRAPACCPIAGLVLQYRPTWNVKLFRKVGHWQHCLASIPGRPGLSSFWAVRFYLIGQNWPVLDTSISILFNIGMISKKNALFISYIGSFT